MRLDRVLAAQLERLSAEFASAGAEQGDESDVDQKGKTLNHRDGMNKGASSEAVCSKVEIWGRQVAGCARAVRQYDLDTEISQTCGSKRHRKPV